MDLTHQKIVLNKRKPYVKPLIECVVLNPEEHKLSACVMETAGIGYCRGTAPENNCLPLPEPIHPTHPS
jgi:hypothetical protein